MIVKIPARGAPAGVVVVGENNSHPDGKVVTMIITNTAFTSARIARHSTRMQLLLLLIAPSVACIFAFATTAHAAIPGAENKKAFTEHDYVKAALAYQQRTLSQAYKDNGKKDPKWDTASIKFLDAIAPRFANAEVSEWAWLPNTPTVPDVLKLADAAVNAGCDDPLVRYCRVALLDDGTRSPAEIGPIVQAAAEEMFQGKYPVNRALAAQRRLYKLTDANQRERPEQVLDGWYDLAVAAVVHWKYTGIDQRLLYDHIWTDVLTDGVPRRTKFVADIVAAGDAVDPWMRHMIVGAAEVRLAWEARGSGLANTVTEAGWQGFHEHLERAGEHLAAAHQAKPNFPEAPAEMMEVMLGQSGDSRGWFDKTVAAQIDYFPAYHRMLWSLRPRWGGSHEEMYAFGVECLQTKRFDTRVPEVFLTALNNIAEDAGSTAIYKQPGVYENANDYFTGLIAQNKKMTTGTYYPSYHAAFAWRCGRFDEARKRFDALGADLNERAFLNFNVMGRLAASQAYAMRDGLAETVTAIEQQAAAGDVAGAAAAYGKAVAPLAADDRARYYLRSREKQLQWQQQFAAGQWVDIKPDKNFIGWQPINGVWTVGDDGVVEGTVNQQGCWMICQSTLFGEDNFEVEVTLELPDSAGGDAGGVAFALSDDLTKYWGLFLRRGGGGQVTLNFDLAPVRRDPVQLQPRNIFTLKFENRRASATLNGKEIFRDHPIKFLFNGPRPYLGVGNRQSNQGSKMRLIALRVRRVGEGGGGG